MKSYILATGLAVMIGISSWAQDIYQMEAFTREDLNGTARYVGMGGAMSALGADLSVMRTNAAGIGLYRKSDVAGTLSFVTQEEGTKFDGKDKTHVSFDNLGFVYVMKIGDASCEFLNFGFNYQKQRNFNMLTSSAGYYGGASQTWQMADIANTWGTASSSTPLADMGEQVYLIGDNGEGYECFNAKSTAFNKAQWGSTQSYNFNLSTNFSERFYLGLTVGAQNINYKSSSLYGEELLGANMKEEGDYMLENTQDITGFGANVNIGFIARPIEESPFRLGFAVTTPTVYHLKYRSYARLTANYDDDGSSYHADGTADGFKYSLKTPWKFNVSMGHVIARCLALGVEYEYSDYSAAKISYDDGWDFYGRYYSEDVELSRQADKYLKGVSTLKVGAEWMIDPTVAIRAGYNYVTSPMSGKAFLNQTISSNGLQNATATDYMNLSAINRFTLGIGFTFGQFYADAAFQYQKQDGHLYSFNTQNGYDTNENQCGESKLKLNRTQVLVTLGYRF